MTHLQKYNQTLHTICQYLFERKFHQSEATLLKLIESILQETNAKNTHETLTEPITVTNTIYKEFNNYYLEWVKNQGGNITKEIHDLYSNEHGNFLIAHCKEAADMDDLLYEVNTYLIDPLETEQKQEAEYYLLCYKKYLNS